MSLVEYSNNVVTSVSKWFTERRIGRPAVLKNAPSRRETRDRRSTVPYSRCSPILISTSPQTQYTYPSKDVPLQSQTAPSTLHNYASAKGLTSASVKVNVRIVGFSERATALIPKSSWTAISCRALQHERDRQEQRDETIVEDWNMFKETFKGIDQRILNERKTYLEQMDDPFFRYGLRESRVVKSTLKRARNESEKGMEKKFQGVLKRMEKIDSRVESKLTAVPKLYPRKKVFMRNSYRLREKNSEKDYTFGEQYSTEGDEGRRRGRASRKRRR